MWAVLSDPGKRGGLWNADEFFATGAQEVESALGLLTELGLQVPRGVALDFGCGVGRATRALSTHFAETIGLDLSARMIAAARALNEGRPTIRFEQNARQDLSTIESGSVDLVYSRLVLQHIVPSLALGYVQEFIRVLSPGGVAVFDLPDLDPRSGFGGLRPALRALREMLPGSAQMSLYATPRLEVEAALARGGGRLIAAFENEPTPGWHGQLYVATRSTRSSPTLDRGRKRAREDLEVEPE